MSIAALADLVVRATSGQHDPLAAIVESETSRGFRVVRPGNVDWFPPADWRPASIASISGNQIRLVLLHAHTSNGGALTRLLDRTITYDVSIIDPTAQLVAALKRRGWCGRTAGHSFETREQVWRKSAEQKGGGVMNAAPSRFELNETISRSIFRGCSTSLTLLSPPPLLPGAHDECRP